MSNKKAETKGTVTKMWHLGQSGRQCPLKCKREIRSGVCCLGEDLLQGEEHLPCGSALYHMKEGLIDLLQFEHSADVRVDEPFLAVLQG